MVLLIDDYQSGITARERPEIREKAHRIFQNAGNRVRHADGGPLWAP